MNLNGPAVRADVLMCRFLRLRARYRKLAQYQLRPPVERCLKSKRAAGFWSLRPRSLCVGFWAGSRFIES
ncbi:hypothetical protein EFP66_05370 [Lacticaseibacillus paracasei]|nr:hypothetical protein [Lacticaseibacillus paracasei]